MDVPTEVIKVGVVIAGIATYFALATPKTPETLTEYLTQRGYTSISVQAPAQCCGRGKLQYGFSAMRKDGRRVAGDVCMGDFVRSHALTERVL
jgi:hypothetical protein